MKLLQIIVELALFALSVIEVIFVIQLNATVRVPLKITIILIGMIILFCLLLAMEWHEGKKNREKSKKMKEEYEAQISDLRKKNAIAESHLEAAKQAGKKTVEMDKPIDVDFKQE